jgi:hypothetical protein
MRGVHETAPTTAVRRTHGRRGLRTRTALRHRGPAWRLQLRRHGATRRDRGGGSAGGRARAASARRRGAGSARRAARGRQAAVPGRAVAGALHDSLDAGAPERQLYLRDERGPRRREHVDRGYDECQGPVRLLLQVLESPGLCRCGESDSSCWSCCSWRWLASGRPLWRC